MCKFHEDIALDVARRPDGTIDTLAFAINAVALGTNFSIGDYVPAMPDIGGHETYKMASRKGREVFAQSGIAYDPDAFALYKQETLPYLQERTARVMASARISPRTHTYLKKERQAVGFINFAPDELFQPFNSLSANTFKTPREAELYQGLRLAAATYWHDDQVQKIFSERFKQSIAINFMEARDNARPKLLKLYEALPDELTGLDKYVSGMGASIGGTAIGHVGCAFKLTLAAWAVEAGLISSAGAAGMVYNPAITYGLMTTGSFLGIAAWHYMHRRRGSIPSRLQKSITYGAAIASLAAFTAWHELDDSHEHHGQEEFPGSVLNVSYFTDEAGQAFKVEERIIGCGAKVVKDTLADGTIHDTLVQFTQTRLDTSEIPLIPQSQIQRQTPQGEPHVLLFR